MEKLGGVVRKRLLLTARVGFLVPAIKDLPQNQAVRGRAHAGGAAIGFGEHGFNFVGRKFSVANLHERADDAATHLVEKAIAFDDESELRTGFFERTTRQGANGAIHFVFVRGGKGFEIVFADEQFSGGTHGGII